MTRLHFACLAAELAAAVAAWALARRRCEHRPVALTLGILSALAVLRAGLVLDVLRPARAALPNAADPFSTPLALAAVYLDGAAQLAIGASVPALALAVCIDPPRARRAALGMLAAAWVVASIVLAALYPSPLVRGEGLRRVYLAADLAALLVAVAALAAWVAPRRSFRASHVVCLALVGCDLVVLLAPLAGWRPAIFQHYEPAQAALLVTFSALAFYQGVLWRFSTH